MNISICANSGGPILNIGDMAVLSIKDQTVLTVHQLEVTTL